MLYTIESLWYKPACSYHVEERLEFVRPSKMICAAQGLTGSASQNIWHVKKRKNLQQTLCSSLDATHSVPPSLDMSIRRHHLQVLISVGETVCLLSWGLTPTTEKC